MQVPRWIVWSTVALLVGLLGTAMFFLGRDSVSEKPSATVAENAAEPVQPEPSEAPLATAKMVGNWAFADTGCATDYGASYTAGGRFAEGDAGAGIEGRWTIEGGQLVRNNEREFANPDWEETPAVKDMTGTDRFSIIELTATKLVFKDDQGQQFSYMRCDEGQRSFLDGEVVKSS